MHICIHTYTYIRIHTHIYIDIHTRTFIYIYSGLPGGSDGGKESTCNAEDLDSFPGLRRSPGEGKDYPLKGLENPWTI